MPVLSRRAFLKSVAVLPAASALPALPALHWPRRGERVKLGCVGVWNRGRANLEGVLSEEIVALCDVDSRHLTNAAKLVERRSGTPLRARLYADFREMLEEQDLDAVVVSTPDHTHAPVAAAAMRRGLHVYCEKPLTHSVHEVRVLRRLAQANGLVTQMGTQIHAGENYRRVVELIRAGAIGRVKEVQVWCNKSWSKGRFGPQKPVPEYLDWDLWQGPVPTRDYCDGLHPANWRRFWSYGTGTLGDMACHYVDLAHWALDLTLPDEIRAAGPDPHPDGTPPWIEVRWTHAVGTERQVTVEWFDGEAAKRVAEPGFGGGGLRFFGSDGTLVSDYGRHVLQPEGDFADHERPAETIPPSVGHLREWLDGIVNGTPTTCDFAYSGSLAETVLLGNVAYRIGRPTEEGGHEGAFRWDGAQGRALSAAVPASFLKPDVREGWDL